MDKQAIKYNQSENKTCPLLSLSSSVVNYMGVNNSTVLCVKEECAWWNGYYNCCAIHILGR